MCAYVVIEVHFLLVWWWRLGAGAAARDFWESAVLGSVAEGSSVRQRWCAPRHPLAVVYVFVCFGLVGVATARVYIRGYWLGACGGMRPVLVVNIVYIDCFCYLIASRQRPGQSLVTRRAQQLLFIAHQPVLRLGVCTGCIRGSPLVST